MNSRGTTRTLARRMHARRRAEERYGLILHRRQLEEIAGLIRNGRAELLERQSHTRTKWRLSYQGRDLLVMYSSSTRQVITFLPDNAAQETP